MSSAATDTQTAHPPPRSRRRRVFVALGLVATVALIAGGVLWMYSANATTNDDSANGHASTRTTDEIVLGDLQGDTTVTGTLKFSGSRSIQANADGTVTALPQSGSVLKRGDRLYAIDDVPSFLLSGALPAWRDFASGMEDGPDVTQLEQNLRDLSHFSDEPDKHFRWATAEAIMKWQEANGLPRTGALPLGSVVFANGDLRVGEISNGTGTRVGPGTTLYDATATTQVVEASVKLGDQQLAVPATPVTVRLPGGGSTTGKISSVGTPTEIDGANGQKQTVIPIVVSLDNPATAAAFQQASVSVSIPSEKREGVLSVPVEALIAITPQQFGVEIVDSDGSTTKAPVKTGLFAGGRVEISGDDIEAGQRVVVPQR
ncbi:peptidoglycan-binding protein [Micromonospora sp. NPDC049903]|uniref:peptidoglycan-binding protein n=1 Tax=Micromonospora sp. NPDC049903 TaxID=3364276 RepID=UPI0037B33B56